MDNTILRPFISSCSGAWRAGPPEPFVQGSSPLSLGGGRAREADMVVTEPRREQGGALAVLPLLLDVSAPMHRLGRIGFGWDGMARASLAHFLHHGAEAIRLTGACPGLRIRENACETLPTNGLYTLIPDRRCHPARKARSFCDRSQAGATLRHLSRTVPGRQRYINMTLDSCIPRDGTLD